MKEVILKIVRDYLKLFPKEEERLKKLLEYLCFSNNDELTNWNNQAGHITAGAFVYAKKEKKFLVLLHRDLSMFLYPGGHMEKEDSNPLETAKRELQEETGIEECKLVSLSENKMIPMDIDIHIIERNLKIGMPEHIHFDFRYLFYIDSIGNVEMDEKEFETYKWISEEELSKDCNYGFIIEKIKKLREKGG